MNDVQAIHDRIRRFMEGDLPSLWEDFKGQGIAQSRSRRSSNRQTATMQDKVDRVHDAPFLHTLKGLMQDGAFSKAVRHLLSDGVHDALDDAVRSKLSSLHPAAQPIPHDHNGTPMELG